MAIAIACSKVWDKDLLSKLQIKLGEDLVLITNQSQLTEENLLNLKIDRIFFPHWSYIIKPNIFNKFECIIFHMTDLPFGRGGSPLQNLIVRGLKETKITALRCAAGIDSGPIYLKRELSLEGSATDIFLRATCIIEEMIVDIIRTNPVPVEQVGEIVQFERRRPDDSNLKNVNDLDKIYDYIRMLDAEGYPPAYIENNGIFYEFHSVEWTESGLKAEVRIVKK